MPALRLLTRGAEVPAEAEVADEPARRLGRAARRRAPPGRGMSRLCGDRERTAGFAASRPTAAPGLPGRDRPGRACSLVPASSTARLGRRSWS